MMVFRYPQHISEIILEICGNQDFHDTIYLLLNLARLPLPIHLGPATQGLRGQAYWSKQASMKGSSSSHRRESMFAQKQKSHPEGRRAIISPDGFGKIGFAKTSNIPVIDLTDNVAHAYAARFHSTCFSPMNGANRVRASIPRRRSTRSAQPQCRYKSRFSHLGSGLHCDRKVYRTLARSIAEPPSSHTCSRVVPENRR
jgi:hypothetical protein